MGAERKEEVKELQKWLDEFRQGPKKRPKAELKSEAQGLEERIEGLTNELSLCRDAREKAEAELKARPRVDNYCPVDYAPRWKLALVLSIGVVIGAVGFYLLIHGSNLVVAKAFGVMGDSLLRHWPEMD